MESYLNGFTYIKIILISSNPSIRQYSSFENNEFYFVKCISSFLKLEYRLIDFFVSRKAGKSQETRAIVSRNNRGSNVKFH